MATELKTTAPTYKTDTAGAGLGKKFVYVGGTGKLGTAEARTQLWTDMTSASGKYYKSIVFVAETNQIWNRGVSYGLSATDAARITSLETAQAALSKAQLATASGEKVLTVTDGAGDDAGKKFISSTLGLNWDSANKKLQLTGKDNAVVDEIDVTDFVKDGMLADATLVTEAETNVTDAPVLPYIKLTFNTEAGSDPVRFSVKDLVDVYNGVNLLLSDEYADVDTYTAANVKKGASMDTVIAELKAGLAAAISAAGVTSFGSKSGAITLDADATAVGAVNFTMNENELQGTVAGLGDIVSHNVAEFATATQGETADSAIQSVTIAGKTLDKSNNTVTAAELSEALATEMADDLDLSSYAKDADVLKSVGGGTTTYITTSASTKSDNNQNITATAVTATIASQAVENATDGLVTAADAYSYAVRLQAVEDHLVWEEL